MRCLFVPRIITAELAAESDWSIYRSIIDMLSAREPSFFYAWLRRGDEDAANLWENVEYFAEETQLQFYAQSAGAVTGRLFELFNRQSGPYPVDAVFTSRAGLVPSLMNGLAHTPDHPVTCVVMDPHVYVPGAAAHDLVTELGAAPRALGYALGLGVYYSDWEREEAMRCVDLWLSPAARRLADERSFVCPVGVDVPADALDRRPKQDRKRILFCGRLNTNKRWADILDAYAKVAMKRDDMDVWVHAGTGAFKKLDGPGKSAPNAKWHHTTERLPLRSDYHKLLATASVAAYGSDDEGANATVLEMLAWGIGLALRSRTWVKKLFWPLEYPFQYKTFKELPELLDWMLDNEDEVRRRLTPIREMIQAKHGVGAWESGWGHVFDAVADENKKYAPSPLFRAKGWADILFEEEDEISLASLLAAGNWTQGQPGRPQRAALAFSRYAAYRGVEALDDFKHAQVHLVKGGVS